MIYTIKEINKHISQKLILIILVLIILNSCVFSLIYIININNAKNIEKDEVKNIVKAYINQIESPIKSLVSQETFFNFLLTNETLFKEIPEFRKEMLFRTFSTRFFESLDNSVIGYRIENHSFTLFRTGYTSNNYIAYNLCYRHGIYDEREDSLCLGTIYIYFKKSKVKEFLESKKLILSSSDGLSIKQIIENNTSMSIYKISLNNIFISGYGEIIGLRLIFLFLCSLVINILFAFMVSQRSKLYYMKYYVEPLLEIYKSLGAKTTVEKKAFYTREIKRLINIINKARKRGRLDTLAQIKHDLKPAFLELQRITEKINTLEHKESLITICSHINMAINNANNDKQIKIENISYLIKQVVNSVFYTKKDMISLNLDRKCFANIEKNTFLRIISNLIQNSFANNKGNQNLRIAISTKFMFNNVYISVEDNGVGIPESKKEIIFEYGISYNNSSGSGLAFCREKLKEVKGSIHCIPTIGKITFEIKLPSSNASYSYIDSIYINNKSKIIVIDDDIPEYLFNISNELIYEQHLKNEYEVEEYFKSSKKERENDIYLVDYHFSDNLNGLQIIHKYKLFHRAYIVSSAGNILSDSLDYEKESIPILEKGNIDYVKVINVETISLIILEDNILIAQTMFDKAKKLNLSFLVLNNFLQFNMLKKLIKKDISLVLDINISGSKIDGLKYIEELNKSGFSDISVQSGDPDLKMSTNISILEKGEIFSNDRNIR